MIFEGVEGAGAVAVDAGPPVTLEDSKAEIGVGREAVEAALALGAGLPPDTPRDKRSA